MPLLGFRQVDVFTDKPFLGNPLAVITDAAALSDSAVRAIARWTNLSETTFVLPPSSSASDYRVRILTPETELMFAGHPTLGTCAALVAEGRVKVRSDGTVVQECGIGLVTIRVLSSHCSSSGGSVIGRFAFRAPPVRSMSAPLPHAPVLAAVGLAEGSIDPSSVSQPHVVNIGISWLLAELPSQATLAAAVASAQALQDLSRRFETFGLTVFAPAPQPVSEEGYDIEIRTFLMENGAVVEDPVCGSANACVAHFLQLLPSLRERYLESGAKTAFVARQGSALLREGRIYVSFEAGDTEHPVPWVAGDVTDVVKGTISA
jgi:PhzF family phenazine biosynthesis protein